MGSLKKSQLIRSSCLASYREHIDKEMYMSEELYYTDDIIQLKFKKKMTFSSIKKNKILLIIQSVQINMGI